MKRICHIAIILSVLASCARVDELVSVSEDSVGVVATIGADSRVSEDGRSFLQGDVIKVENKSRDTNNIAEFTYDEDKEAWSTDDLLYWEGLDDNSFIAWYPVSASYGKFTIPASQVGGVADCDWMTSNVVAKKEDGDIMLSFTHHLSKVIVEVEAWKDEFAASERIIRSLSLLSLSTVMQNDGALVTGDAEPQFVETLVVEPNSRFAAILAPGTYLSGSEIMRLSVGEQVLSVKTADDITIKPANAYTFSLTIGKDVMALSEDGVSVDEWITVDLGEADLADGVLELDPAVEPVIEVPIGGGDISIPLNANVDYETSVEYDEGEEEWVMILDGNTKAAQTSLDIRLLPNMTCSARRAVLSIFNTILNVSIDIELNQPAFTGLDDTGFDPDKYMTYVSNYYRETSGGVFDTDIYVYRSRISNPCDAAVKWEFKFKLARTPGQYENCYIYGEYLGRDNSDEVCLNSSGLSNAVVTLHDWDEMGVQATDVMVMTFDMSDKTVSVNGTTFSYGTQMPRVDYLFSGHYYDRDDGYYSVYYGFQDDARMYYVKGWDAQGRLVYLGGPSMEYADGVLEACWTADYYDADGVVRKQKVFSYKDGDSKEPFGYGNLLGEDMVWEDDINLTSTGTANCYIVNKASSYKFAPTKGNSSMSVGTIASVEVLWESFGTTVVPNVGDLIRNVSYSDGYIRFETPKSLKEGNAVIAAKDADGNILWSWHIWLTDMPQDHTYANNAGVLMDRNLGATSVTPGDVQALGLHYQWGRKDPFVGTASISSYVPVGTTAASWDVISDYNMGTIEYSIAHPTTKINSHYSNYDWLYTGSDVSDNTRWQSEKTIYDPCPQGYRVTEGTVTGRVDGVWPKAFGGTHPQLLADDVNNGFVFSEPYCSHEAWYPTPGYWGDLNSKTFYTGYSTYYWTVTPFNGSRYVRSMLYLIPGNDFINTAGYDDRSPAGAFLIRCQKI